MDNSEQRKQSKSSVNVRFSKLQTKSEIVQENSCVLHLANSIDYLASTSISTLHVWDKSTLKQKDNICITQLNEESKIVDLVLEAENSNHVYVCHSTEGVNLFDIRKDLRNGPASRFSQSNGKDYGNSKQNNLSSADVNCKATILCAGTELAGEDSFLLFWDLRSSKLLGAYSESHSDDITQLRFHPTAGDTLASGSTDGLINIFDISQSDEDDALTETLNTDSSVDKLSWHLDGDKQLLSCLTHTEHLQVWDTQDGGCKPEWNLDRKSLFREEDDSEGESKSLVQCFGFEGSSFYVVGNSSDGKARVVVVEGGRVVGEIVLGERERLVKCATLDHKRNLLFTGCEDGTINSWSVKTWKTSY